MLFLVLNHAVLRVLWKIDVYLLSTLVNKKAFIINSFAGLDNVKRI